MKTVERIIGYKRGSGGTSGVAYLNKALNDVVQSDAFRSRMAALGMTIPADNTPERLTEYMRRESKHQGELAGLTGIQMTAPPPK